MDLALQEIPEKRSFRTCLSDSWADFIKGFQFDWFLTLTFRESKHPEAAHKLWRKFVNDLNRNLYGRRTFRDKTTQHDGIYCASFLS